MSLQTQETRTHRIAFAPRFALSMILVAVILAVALGPIGGGFARVAREGHLHAPNLAMWAALSVPVKIHLATAFGALALGAVLMAVRKGRTFHRIAGWVWVSLVSVTAGATLFIKVLNNGTWSFLHLFTAWVLLILPLGVMAAKRHAVAQHRARMMGLFYGAFAINLAFAFIPGRTLWVMFFG